MTEKEAIPTSEKYIYASTLMDNKNKVPKDNTKSTNEHFVRLLEEKFPVTMERSESSPFVKGGNVIFKRGGNVWKKALSSDVDVIRAGWLTSILTYRPAIPAMQIEIMPEKAPSMPDLFVRGEGGEPDTALHILNFESIPIHRFEQVIINCILPGLSQKGNAGVLCHFTQLVVNNDFKITPLHKEGTFVGAKKFIMPLVSFKDVEFCISLLVYILYRGIASVTAFKIIARLANAVIVLKDKMLPMPEDTPVLLSKKVAKQITCRRIHVKDTTLEHIEWSLALFLPALYQFSSSNKKAYRKAVFAGLVKGMICCNEDQDTAGQCLINAYEELTGSYVCNTKKFLKVPYNDYPERLDMQDLEKDVFLP